MKPLCDLPMATCAFSASPWFEDHSAFKEGLSDADNMATCIQLFADCCHSMVLPPYPLGCKEHKDEPVCRREEMDKAIWYDPMAKRDLQVFYDKVAVQRVLNLRFAPQQRAPMILATMSRSHFSSDVLISTYDDLVDNASSPQFTVPVKINYDLLDPCIKKVVSKWQLKDLLCYDPMSVPFNNHASAGVSYFGRNRQTSALPWERGNRLRDLFLPMATILDVQRPLDCSAVYKSHCSMIQSIAR